MSEIEKMKRYIERTNIKDNSDAFCMRSRDVVTLLTYGGQADAIMLAFDYGRAKGYRAAKAEVKHG
ncbi:hypothetical protein AALC17_01555 [Oscillospiraceae bacterium 38-13]